MEERHRVGIYSRLKMKHTSLQFGFAACRQNWLSLEAGNLDLGVRSRQTQPKK